MIQISALDTVKSFKLFWLMGTSYPISSHILIIIIDFSQIASNRMHDVNAVNAVADYDLRALSDSVEEEDVESSVFRLNFSWQNGQNHFLTWLFKKFGWKYCLVRSTRVWECVRVLLLRFWFCPIAPDWQNNNFEKNNQKQQACAIWRRVLTVMSAITWLQPRNIYSPKCM